MKLKQLENLIIIDTDTIDTKHGSYYDQRTIHQLLKYGFILLDKPPGPSSHQIVATIKQILNISKAGHSGTLDPSVSGILPIGLNNATKILNILHLGPKEYHAIGRLHSLPSKNSLQHIIQEFTGKIYQKPPQRSAVLRRTRIRNIFELEIMDQMDRLLLLRICCESGTYIRKLIYDIGEILGIGATMIELRRNRVHQFHENNSTLITLHELATSYNTWKEQNNPKDLITNILPIEIALSEIKAVVIRDSAVNSLCYGAQLAIPGILQISKGLVKGDLVGIYTQKSEIVALAESLLTASEIENNSNGYAFKTKRIIIDPDVYPKHWIK